MIIFDNVISVDISVINVMLVISFDINVTSTDMNMVAVHVPSVVMVITNNDMPLLLTLL